MGENPCDMIADASSLSYAGWGSPGDQAANSVPLPLEETLVTRLVPPPRAPWGNPVDQTADSACLCVTGIGKAHVDTSASDLKQKKKTFYFSRL
jgi:hypothetical protein